MADLVSIASFDDLGIASLARARLEAAGIPCFLTNEYLVGLNWLYTRAVGGVELKVPTAEAEEARELLSQDFSAQDLQNLQEWQELQELNDEIPPEALELLTPPPSCPHCGSSDIQDNSLRRPLGALSLLTGIPLPFAPRWSKCRNCGKRWRS